MKHNLNLAELKNLYSKFHDGNQNSLGIKIESGKAKFDKLSSALIWQFIRQSSDYKKAYKDTQETSDRENRRQKKVDLADNFNLEIAFDPKISLPEGVLVATPLLQQMQPKKIFDVAEVYSHLKHKEKSPIFIAISPLATKQMIKKHIMEWIDDNDLIQDGLPFPNGKKREFKKIERLILVLVVGQIIDPKNPTSKKDLAEVNEAINNVFPNTKARVHNQVSSLLADYQLILSECPAVFFRACL